MKVASCSILKTKKQTKHYYYELHICVLILVQTELISLTVAHTVLYFGLVVSVLAIA